MKRFMGGWTLAIKSLGLVSRNTAQGFFFLDVVY